MGKVCCIFGHREINQTKELENAIYETAERLIGEENVSTFLFGSKSQFNEVCYDIIAILKEKYPHIKRVYVRSAFPDIWDWYKDYLLESYEDTYFPEKVRGAGRASYVERNREMIDKSDFCLVYYREDYVPSPRRRRRNEFLPQTPKSGTRIAYDYAMQKGKIVINTK